MNKKEEKNKDVWSQISKNIGKKIVDATDVAADAADVAADALSGKTRPVGGRIPVEKYDVWERLKLRAKESGMSTSEYFVDSLETIEKINDVLFPIADSFSRKRIEFKNDMMRVLVQSVEGLDSAELIKKSDKLHEEISTTLKGRMVDFEK